MDIKLYCKNFIDIVLENYQYVSQHKKYYLILEIIILGPKSFFSVYLFCKFLSNSKY